MDWYVPHDHVRRLSDAPAERKGHIVRRLILLLLAPLLVVLALPGAASASPFVPVFTANGESETVTVTAGDDVTFAWEAFSPGESTVDLRSEPFVAGWDETGVEDDGTRTLTLAEPGTYTFIVAVNIDDQGEAGLDEESVEVVVLPAEVIEVDPAPITFPTTCSVLIPASTGDNVGVQYGYGTGNSGSDLAAGTYDLAELASVVGVELTFGAIPLDGYTFPEGTMPFFAMTPDASCFGGAAGDGGAAAPTGRTPTVAPAAGVTDQGSPVGALVGVALLAGLALAAGRRLHRLA